MKRKANFIIRDVGGEKLLVPLGEQVMNLPGVLMLNSTAAFVWDLLAEERSTAELASAVSEHFDVAFELASCDVQGFLSEISQLGLLES